MEFFNSDQFVVECCISVLKIGSSILSRTIVEQAGEINHALPAPEAQSRILRVITGVPAPLF